MKFIKLAQADGNPVYININCIAEFRHSRTEYNITHIALANGHSYSVFESPEEVLELIEKAEKE